VSVKCEKSEKKELIIYQNMQTIYMDHKIDESCILSAGETAAFLEPCSAPLVARGWLQPALHSCPRRKDIDVLSNHFILANPVIFDAFMRVEMRLVHKYSLRRHDLSI
jgi:hypothetical protein